MVLTDQSVSGKWFAIQVRAKSEIGVAAALESKGYRPFVPAYRPIRHRTPTSNPVPKPLFPGYLFCRLGQSASGPIVTTPGVVRIVGYGNVPTPVEESEIEALKAVIESGLPAEPWPSVRPGQIVRIAKGPLSGIEGVVWECNRRLNLVVSVAILQRSALVELKPEWVTPAGGSN